MHLSSPVLSSHDMLEALFYMSLKKVQWHFGQAERDVAKSELDNAKADLNDTYLRATFKGEIGQTYFEKGENVRAKQPVLGLHGTDIIEIVTNVPEVYKANFDPEFVFQWSETARLAAQKVKDLVIAIKQSNLQN